MIPLNRLCIKCTVKCFVFSLECMASRREEEEEREKKNDKMIYMYFCKQQKDKIVFRIEYVRNGIHVWCVCVCVCVSFRILHVVSGSIILSAFIASDLQPNAKHGNSPLFAAERAKRMSILY